DVLDTLAMLTLKGGDRLRAYNLIREAAQRAPERPEIQLHLATVLLDREQRTEAHEVLRALIAKFPNAPEAQEARQLLAKAGARDN
ncbi:MAG: tetratricopeptide repeat protein, partial [Gammaproteobacteria bacterium]|nr:tetratricopeptide repeat protein [Gammaproteobacteria bacterium]